MSIVAIAVFPVDPDRLEHFLRELRGVLPDTRAFDGCEAIDVHVDLDVPGRVVLLERWPTRDHHRAYLRWRLESGTAAAIEPFLTDRITFSYLAARPEV